MNQNGLDRSLLVGEICEKTLTKMKSRKYSLSRHCKGLTAFCIVLIIVIGVPALLNWLLQNETPLKSVIGGENAPEDWLRFWGSYLAAIGTAASVYVAYRNNNKERRRNFHKEKQLASQQEYKETETEVKHFERILSMISLAQITDDYKKGEVLSAKVKYHEWNNQLNEIVFFGMRHKEDPVYTPYTEILKQLYNFFTNATELFSRILLLSNNNSQKKELEDQLAIISTSLEKESLISELYRRGWDLLDALSEEIKNNNQELKDASSIYEE